MYRTIKLGRISTSNLELRDITKAWIVIALTFAVLQLGINLFNDGSFPKLLTPHFLTVALISLFTVGIGFLLHELAHKFVAVHYGCTAEFRAFDRFLYLALGLALAIGFTFIAPGAVMISGMITRRENGIISAAGPLTNYVLGLIFLGLGYLFPAGAFIFGIGFTVNFWLGLFNMIPLGNLDGIKIFRWNPYVWAGMAAFGAFFIFFF